MVIIGVFVLLISLIYIFLGKNFFGKNELSFCPDSGNCQDFGLLSRRCESGDTCVASCNYGCVNEKWLKGKADCEAKWNNFNCECRNKFCQKY